MCTDSAARQIIERLGQDDLEYIYHESFCLVAALKTGQDYNSTALLRRIFELGSKALSEGRDRSKRASQEWILRALDGGAGQAHKVANKANALPELRLIFKETTEQGSEFVTDPYRVAMHHAAPWAAEWESNDLHKFGEELRALVDARLAHLEDAGVFCKIR